MMWLATTWLYVPIESALKRNHGIRSLKVCGLAFPVPASVCAIYMNRDTQPRDFYLATILGNLIVFTIVAIANGFCIRCFFGREYFSRIFDREVA